MADYTLHRTGGLHCRKRNQKNKTKNPRKNQALTSKAKSKSLTLTLLNGSKPKKQKPSLDTIGQFPQTNGVNNRDQGALFEAMFKKRAQINGMFAEKNNLAARRLPGGRILVLKSDLDYKLINQAGRVGFFDCKSFIGNKFTYSQLDPDQLKKSETYNYYNVPSGFVVWFRLTNEIVYFNAFKITQRGQGASFTALDGITLGSIENFDLKPLLK